MKKLSTLIAAVFISIQLFAQAPQKMSYQAVIRNASNNLVTNAPVKMRISILQGNNPGTSVYSELHSATTNANGLVSIEIGEGTNKTGTFSSINWGSGAYFLKTETDPNNGTNYSIVGTSQLLSVPYAIVSNNASSAGDGIKKVSSTGDSLLLNNGNYIIIPGISNANSLCRQCNPILTYGIVMDIDGNEYKTIQIGSQVWMAENLRVTKYRNGVLIPNIINDVQWSNNTGAWTYYNNKPENNIPYGKLYNWNAVVNGNNICPSGWHIPTDAEWTTLVTNLGGDAIAGGKLKSTGNQFWETPNQDATNSSGFSAIPGGFRSTIDGFFNLGGNGYYWSKTQGDADNAWSRIMNFSNGFASRVNFNKSYGISVRCIKD